MAGVSLSVDQAYTDDQAFHSPDPNVISVDEAYGGKAKPASTGTIAKAGRAIAKPFVQTGEQWWNEYTQELQSAKDQLKADVKPGIEANMSLVGRAVHGLKTGMDAASYLWTPASATVQTFGVGPSNAALDWIKEKLQNVAPEKTNNPWGISKKDIDRTIETLKQFNATGQQTLAGMIGGKEIPEEVPKEVPEEPPEEIGGKPHLKMMGTDTATGKPRVRVVTPEQASAKVAQTMSQAHQEMMTTEAFQAKVPRTHALWTDWHTLNAKMASRYEQARQGGTPIGAHTVLDTMIPNAGSYSKPFLLKLRQYVPDIPVHFVDVIKDAKGEPSDPKVTGTYTWYEDPGLDHIQVKVDPDSSSVSRVLAHEMVHAATARFIHANPEHPLVKELNELHAETVRLAQDKKLEIEARTGASLGPRLHYGEMNTKEFVAEAMSNPRFQDFLAGIRIKGRTAWHALASVVRRMLGMGTATEDNMLHSVMKASVRIMEEQRRAGTQASTGVAAMTLENTKDALEKSPAIKKLSGYVDELQRAVSPESLGKEAKVAGAVIASRISQRMARTEVWRVGSEPRTGWWKERPELTRQFLKGFESGQAFKDPDLEALRQTYKTWSEDIYKHETQHLGLTYTPRDNYIMHVFENQKGLEQELTRKFGKKWMNPRFIKDRVFDLYDEAIKAGFKPKYTNPEEIMLARQMSSDLVDMQVGILKDLAKYGLAVEKVPGMKLKPGVPGTTWRSPTGKWYFVHPDAEQVLNNAFLSRSLWSQPGMLGDAFRGAMGLKNAIVGPRLALSLFHALHVIHIDNMDAAATALGDVVSGKRSAVSGLGELLKSGLLLPRSLWENPRAGSRLVNVWKGKIPASELSDTDVQNLQFMLEGGFVPRLPDVYRIAGGKSFKQALQEHSMSAIWKLPGALLSTLQKPIFEVWIPNLKAASYMRSVESALARDSSLMDNAMKRQLAFRKISKSVDNRYGEMSYNTLFWKRWIKDLAVMDTLSLGWQLGFIREYGGGALDLGQFVRGSDKIKQIREGQLDKPLFVSMYTATALGYGGLLTWAMTGKSPQGLMDYVYPQTGGQNPDGSPKRVNTMFYTREFGDLYKHMRNEGIVSGLSDLAMSKSSGLFGLMGEWAKGVNDYGQEIRDPNAPAFKQLEQTLASTLKDLEPISLKASGVSGKQTALGIAGFSPVPAYVQETRTQARIKSAYLRYEKGAVQPYDKAEQSQEYSKLRQQYAENDPGFYDTVDELQTKYGVSRVQIDKMLESMKKGISPSMRMFSSLPWQEQKALLDQMSEEERETYLPHSNRTHLRRHYEAP